MSTAVTAQKDGRTRKTGLTVVGADIAAAEQGRPVGEAVPNPDGLPQTPAPQIPAPQAPTPQAPAPEAREPEEPGPGFPASTAPRQAPDLAPARPSGRKRLLRAGAALAVLSLAAWYGHGYWTVGRFMVTTDDAYVGASIASIAPRLSAHVVEVVADANQNVKKGDVLIRLDEADFRLALDQAVARRATQEASLQRIRAQIATAQAGIAQAEALKQAADADLMRTESALERTTKLISNDFASRASLDNAKADRDRARAQVANASAGILNAKAQHDLAEAQFLEARQGAAELDLAVAKARHDLQFTTITAPIDGVVAARSVQVGDFVGPGKRLMSLVPLHDVFIDANFKETQLRQLVPGERVAIEVDAYPGQEFEGRVIGLAAGTGSTFSLLPTDNATGNFTKIIQRVPVRIAVSQPDGAAVLRPGMSVTARVDTRTAPAQVPGRPDTARP